MTIAYDLQVPLTDTSVEWVRIVFFDSSVCILNSVALNEHDAQKYVCKFIVNYEDTPENVKKRGWRSLRREWRAHNLLYHLPLLPKGWKDRLRDVDLDSEPLWRRVVYAILAFINL